MRISSCELLLHHTSLCYPERELFTIVDNEENYLIIVFEDVELMMLSCSKHRPLHCSFMVFHGHILNFSSSHKDELGKALQAAKSMDQGGLQASRDIVYALLQRCVVKKDLNSSRYVHCLMVNHGLDFIAPLADHLIRLFMLCGSLIEANGVFLHVSKPSLFTWNAIISAHVNLSEGILGLDLFVEMQQDGLKPDKVTFLCVIKCCSNMQDLGCGRVLHDLVMRSDITFDAAIGNTIVDMYVKCGYVEEARAMFDVLPDRDNVSWGVMIAGYVTHDSCEQALKLFTQIPEEEALSSSVVLSCTLKACGKTRLLQLGRLVHNAIEKYCFKGDLLIGSALVTMYSSFGLLDEARKVFDQIHSKNVNMWVEMIGGYAEHGFCDEALELFESMRHEGLKPDKLSCLRVLKACGSLGALRQGRLMYDYILRSGLDLDTMVVNTVIDVFAKCGILTEAWRVFSVAKVQDVVSWSVMIAGYAQQGDGYAALDLFQKMQLKGFAPSKVSYLGAMKACGNMKDLHQARKIHDEIANTGLMADILIGSTLIDMYAKCGSLKEAREVFDALPNRNVVVWGAMIAGYAQHGLGTPALELFKRMQTENHSPDKVLYSSVLQACATIESLSPGRLIHDKIIRDGFELQVIVGNTLIDLYAKCGSVDEARAVFDCLTDRDVVTWATMITGYAQHGEGLAAFQLFESSQEKGIKLNRVVFLGLLRACGGMRAAMRGQVIHNCVVKEGLDKDLVVCNTLLDMYAKSGNLNEAQAVFERMQLRDGVSWSALISGYAWQCEWGHVRECLWAMLRHGVKSDDVTFTNVLTACTHAGLLEEGCWFFRSMREDHNITPSIEHYSCLVDLLSRAGCVHEAQDLLKSIPVHPDLIIWMSLLTSCTVYGNKNVGDHHSDCSWEVSADWTVTEPQRADMRVTIERMLMLKKSLGAHNKHLPLPLAMEGKTHDSDVGIERSPQADNVVLQLSRAFTSVNNIGFGNSDDGILPEGLCDLAEALDFKALYVSPAYEESIADKLDGALNNQHSRPQEKVLAACSS